MTFDKLIDVIKIFFEKYLIATLISVVFTFVIYYITPEDFGMLIKFTFTGYCVFVYLICFLIVTFVTHEVKKIINNYNEQVYLSKESQKQELKTMERLWTDVDGLSANDYKILKYFLDNDNKPVYTIGEYSGYGLLKSKWVYKTEVKDFQNKKEFTNDEYFKENITRFINYNPWHATYQYILKKEIYDLLKQSQIKYGKISHFDKKEMPKNEK